MLIAQHVSGLQLRSPFQRHLWFPIGKHMCSIMAGKKWIGYARLLAEIRSTSCEVYKLPKRAGHPQVPGSLLPGSTEHTYVLAVIYLLGDLFIPWIITTTWLLINFLDTHRSLGPLVHCLYLPNHSQPLGSFPMLYFNSNFIIVNRL